MKNIKKILKDPRTYYVIALLGIFLFPPLMDTYANQDTFEGWHFVSTLAMQDDFQIHIPYMIVEFFNKRGIGSIAYREGRAANEARYDCLPK